MTENNASKRFFAVAAAVIALLLVIVTLGVFLGGDSENYLIAEDGSYVICDGERYVPVGEGIAAQYSSADRIIAENVPIENGDFLDRFFIYGYIIYGSETDDSVIYVHTAESADSATGYYLKETLAEDAG